MQKLFLSLVGLTSILVQLASTKPAMATNMFDPGPPGTCSTDNCDSRFIDGTILESSGFSMPWVTQIAAVQGVCLRIDVLTPSPNLEAVLISPSGIVWRNDNRATGDTRPLIKVNGTPESGWYTLQVSTANGVSTNSDFTLGFGEYVVNNANCLPPTPGF